MASAVPQILTQQTLSPQPRTVVDLFEARTRAEPDKVMLRCKTSGQWRNTTLAQWRQTSLSWAKGLVAMGIQPGDRVLLASQTRAEWLMADVAIQMAGGVTVPLYPSATAQEVAWIAEDSGARLAICENPAQVEKLVAARAQLTNLHRLLLMEEFAALDRPDALGRTGIRLGEVVANGDPWVRPLVTLSEKGAAIETAVVEERWQQLDPEAPCAILYTSGTTGQPKGVVLSHRAFVWEVLACQQALDVRADDLLFLFLPLAHSFAKMVATVCVGVGCPIAMPESMSTLMRDLAEAKPTVMPSVPRVFEKVYTKILAGVESAGPARKQAFRAALAVGRKVSQQRQRGKEPNALLNLQYQLAHRAVFARIHQLLGGRIRGFISGGAPLSRELAEFFHACGMLILEGYGMTENTAAATVNRPDDFKFGTVGKALPGVEIALAKDGEVLIRGGNVMSRYWNNPEATAEILDEDGWLHTGDIGTLDEAGFLTITDRKKDLIITAGGKNVAPQNLESLLKNSRWVSNCMVYGDRRKFLSALITLDEDALAAWAKERGVAHSCHAELTQKPEVWKLIQADLDDKNRALASYETIKKFAILDRDFTVERGELTPSLKLRRKDIVRNYQGLLDSFYSEHY